ncbi:hypothetical protein AAVH_07633 [Aphelenchoides avenae]|nr:hypothetical protein AAVH_07633 [Aphelenchus avenae]
MDWDGQGLPEELVKEQGCEEAEVGSRAVELKTAEVNDQRVKDLEQQLARAQSQHTAAQAELSDMRKLNKDLHDLVDAYVQIDGGGPTGRYSTVDGHLWALGFVRNTQGQLQRTAAQGFNVKQQYTAPRRELHGMMVDSSRTGRLLKMKRFDDLKIRNGTSYLSFTCLIESQVMDAYGDADDHIVDQVKTKVLLNNIRERDLMTHIENALRTARDDEDQFPIVKTLAVSYERTAESADKWHTYGNGPSRGGRSYNPSK